MMNEKFLFIKQNFLLDQAWSDIYKYSYISDIYINIANVLVQL